MRILPFLALSAITAAPLLAQGGEPQDSDAIARARFEATLHYQTGTIQLSGGSATLNLPATLRFLDAKDAKRLLVDAWGNPPDAVDGVLGLIVPADVSPLERGGWASVVSFEEQGYVNDSDAASIDYSALLKTMQDALVDENKERREKGFHEVQLVGWAEPPHYDQTTHKLYWAKELAFSGSDHHTLNYNIRILGRRGVLVLNAVGSMEQLEQIHQVTPQLLGAVEFNEGHRYADFTTGDKVAAVGIAGLILGGAAKAGLFKGLLVALLALKKFVLLGLAAVGAWFKRLFGGKKKDEEGAQPPAAPTATS